MPYDKYDQDIHIVRGKEDNKDSVEDQEESAISAIQNIEEYESTYEQILAKLLETGLVSDSDLSLISSMAADGNVIPFALQERLARIKQSKEYKSSKRAKDLGHFDENAHDLTVGKESGKYTEAQDHSGPVDSKAIDADRQQPEPANKPDSAPFKGPSAPTPPSTPTPKR